jgi:hypothetical protein
VTNIRLSILPFPLVFFLVSQSFESRSLTSAQSLVVL